MAPWSDILIPCGDYTAPGYAEFEVYRPTMFTDGETSEVRCILVGYMMPDGRMLGTYHEDRTDARAQALFDRRMASHRAGYK